MRMGICPAADDGGGRQREINSDESLTLLRRRAGSGRQATGLFGRAIRGPSHACELGSWLLWTNTTHYDAVIDLSTAATPAGFPSTDPGRQWKVSRYVCGMYVQ